MEVKEQHQIHIRRWFAALINSDDTGRFKSVCAKMLQKRYKYALVLKSLDCHILGNINCH